MADAETTAPRRHELTGWHVLLIMLGFFGVIFAVNGVFLYHALTSHPGEIVEKSYLQGLNYNDRLQTRALQAERGWTAAMGVEGGRLVARIEDGTGRGLNHLLLQATLRRTASQDGDLTIALVSTGDGEYQGDLAGISAATYEVGLTGFEGDGPSPVFEARKRLSVR
ncbi:MAG: FixH family protein [Pseudomonadota bacterium]